MNQSQHFSRVLARREVFTLAFGAMIGWGWVILVGNWILRGGALGAVLGFFIAGMALSVIALLYGELASAMPRTGGEHVYSMRALGPRGSFACTWFLVLAYVSVAAFEAVALPTVVEYLLPDFKRVYLWTVAGYDVYLTWVLVGVAGSVFITTLNYLGVKLAGSFQSFATFIIGIGGLVLFAAAFTAGETARLEPLFIDGLGGIAAVAVIAPFLLFGFDIIPQAAEEIDLPPQVMGRIIFISVIIASLWYCLLIFSVATLIAPPDIRQASLPAADSAGVAFGRWGSYLVLAGGICGLLTSWNAFVIGGSRAVFAMAESHMLPAPLAKLHPRYHTPTTAILLIGLIAAIAPFFGRTMLVWIVDAGAFGIVVAYLLVAVSFVVLRYREPDMERPFRVRRGKAMGWLGIVLAGAMWLLYLPGSPAALTGEEWTIVLLWSGLGVALLAWCGKRHTTPH